MSKRTMIKRWMPAGLVIAAVSFPAAAQARFNLDPPSASGTPAGVASRPAAESPAGVASTPPVQTTSSGFQWGDAGIGAAGAVLLLGGGAGAAGGLRRRRAHRPVTG